MRCAARPQRVRELAIFAMTASPAAGSVRGATVASPAGLRPSSAANATAMPTPSSGVRNTIGMLCTIARPDSPAADGIASSAATDPPPADWPDTVTQS